MSTVPVFAPDGTLGDIPAEKLQDAVKAGFKPGVNMIAADGSKGVVPADRYAEATKGGLKVEPFEDQPIKHAGLWHALASDLGGMVTGFPKAAAAGVATTLGVPPDALRSVGLTPPQDMAAELAGNFRERGKAGNSLPYRVGAGANEALGVNVKGEEESAKAGDVGGVLGHAAAVPAAMALTAGVAKGVDIAGGPGAPILKAAAKTADIATFERASKIWNAWKSVPEEIRAKIASDPVYAEANQPPAPAREVLQARALQQGGRPVVDPSEGLAKVPVNTPPPAPVAPGFNKAAVSKQLDTKLNEATGGKGIQPGVKLKDQFKNLPAKDALTSSSSAVKDFKYDPAANELHITSNNGVTYVSGDISPAQAKAFEAADSKGQAWKAIRDNSPLVAKIINGKRISMKGPSGMRSASPDAGANLLVELQQSLKQARARRAASSGD